MYDDLTSAKVADFVVTWVGVAVVVVTIAEV